MQKILLVDDEDLEIHGLLAMIRTFDLPVEVCATAHSGREGLLLAREKQPSIILTDLRMPQMSGTEMMRQLKAEDHPAQFIIISAYEDFEAARMGMELGTCAYLLKPVKRNELYRALSRCCAHQDPERPFVTASTPYPKSLYPPTEERMIRQALSSSEEKINALLSAGDTRRQFENRLFAVAVLERTSTDERDMYDYADALGHFAKQLSAPCPVVIDKAQGALVITAPSFMEESVFLDSLSQTADQLLKLFSDFGENDLYIGISDISGSFLTLSSLYQQGLAALEKRHHFNLSRVYFYDHMDDLASGDRVRSDDSTVLKIQRIIQRDYAQPLSIDGIAEKLFLSASHMRRLFKNNTGMTVMEYVECIRMERARKLLSDSQYKAHRVGNMVGYENPSYFNVVFKKHYGMAPGEYRKTLEAGNSGE